MRHADWRLSFALLGNFIVVLPPLRGLTCCMYSHSPGLRLGLPSDARYAGFRPDPGKTVEIYDALT